MIIIKCDNVNSSGDMEFIYFKENSYTNGYLFISNADIEEINESGDFKPFDKVQKKIIKECIKYAKGKDAFESNKSYKFVDCYKATIELNNCII